MSNEVKNEVFKYILDMAFNDATMRNAFPNPYKKRGEEATEEQKERFHKLKDALKDAVAGPIEIYLTNIIEGKAKENSVYQCIKDVLTNTKEVCENHREEAQNEDFEFTFGHAQKVVNMAAKDLFISCYAQPFLRKHFEYCHCPMDQYMIKGILTKCEEKGIKPSQQKSNLKKSTTWSGLKLKTCDRINDIKEEVPDEYIQFQELVGKLRGELYPLEYEYINWKAFTEEYGENKYNEIRLNT